MQEGAIISSSIPAAHNSTLLYVGIVLHYCHEAVTTGGTHIPPTLQPISIGLLSILGLYA